MSRLPSAVATRRRHYVIPHPRWIMNRIGILASLLLIIGSFAASAQEGPKVVLPDDEPPVFVPEFPGKKSPKGLTKGKEEPKESPRLQKLKALSFDRRPSAILKA